MSDHAPTAGHHDDAGHHHVVPVSLYLTIFAWLGVLTAITVFAAFVHFGALNFPIAMAIATTKATLVVIYFMHVKYASKLVKLTIITSIIFFLLLVVGTLMDYYTRVDVPIAFYQPKH